MKGAQFADEIRVRLEAADKAEVSRLTAALRARSEAQVVRLAVHYGLPVLVGLLSGQGGGAQPQEAAVTVAPYAMDDDDEPQEDDFIVPTVRADWQPDVGMG